MGKGYSDFMNEITPDELYHGLLAYGMFADKLPPVFTAEAFYEYCESMHKAFDGNAHRYIYYENMRNVNIPRSLAIPNPAGYQRQCALIKEYWAQIQEHFRNTTGSQTYKVSRIHIRKMFEQPALFQMNYDNWRADGTPEIDLVFGNKYMVKADISTCFPSIYTHALSWALVGKEEAKKHRNDNSQWYNKIDLYTRRTTHDETHGLLIGPHTSNMLSEIVLTSVDHMLGEWKYIRAIDDYTCYVDTYEDGQRFLTSLGSALREYDLSLNHKKTAIIELPLAATEQWQRKLNTLPITTAYGKTDFILARAYLDHAIELMHKNDENAAILNYAIKTLLGNSLTENAREYIGKTVLSLAFLYPYLVTILDKHVFSICCKECPSHSCISNYSTKIYQNGISTLNFEQSSYAVFFAIKYGFEIQNFSVSEIISSKDCVLLLMAFLYAKRYQKLKDIKALKAYARTLKDDPETFDQYWVFLYEVLPKSDLKAEWVPMKEAGITFIKDIHEW